MKKLFALSFVAATVYLGVAYWPALQKYFALRYSAQKLANRTGHDGRSHQDIRDMLAEVERETGIKLYGRDITIRDPDDQVLVEVEVKLPVEFPWIDKTHEHPMIITGKARKKRGY